MIGRDEQENLAMSIKTGRNTGQLNTVSTKSDCEDEILDKLKLNLNHLLAQSQKVTDLNFSATDASIVRVS